MVSCLCFWSYNFVQCWFHSIAVESHFAFWRDKLVALELRVENSIAISLFWMHFPARDNTFPLKYNDVYLDKDKTNNFIIFLCKITPVLSYTRTHYYILSDALITDVLVRNVN